MNDDASLSVVDPLFGFGGSQLLDMVILESPAEDWVISIDQKRLFVSMPKSDRVAVVETAGWSVEFGIDVGPTPTDMALQPDGVYLWVAFEGGKAGTLSGVSVIDTRTLKEAARIETGRGRHRLALGADNRYAFITNEASGTVSAIDIQKLEKVNPGLGQVRFTRDGRWGFVVNPEEDEVHILDAAARRIVQTGDTEAGPDQVTFTDELAYIRHRGSETVLMIPFAGIGREGAAVPMVDFPGGEKPPGLGKMPSAADTIVQAPGAPAVLVANPLDGAIYFYKEGMAAPMGHFKNYGRKPRAAMVIDRSLREVEPGVYATTVKMRQPGRYDLALFVDSPRVIQCFEVAVDENPALTKARQRFPISVELLTDTKEVEVGRPVSVRIKILDSESKEPKSDLADIEVMTFLAPGLRQQRRLAKALGDGVYELVFTPELEGVYYVFIQIPSQKLRYRESPSLIVMAEIGGAA